MISRWCSIYIAGTHALRSRRYQSRWTQSRWPRCCWTRTRPSSGARRTLDGWPSTTLPRPGAGRLPPPHRASRPAWQAGHYLARPPGRRTRKWWTWSSSSPTPPGAGTLWVVFAPQPRHARAPLAPEGARSHGSEAAAPKRMAVPRPGPRGGQAARGGRRWRRFALRGQGWGGPGLHSPGSPRH
jgi:hypothetical protein